MATQIRAERIVDFFDAAYDLERDDQAWVEGVLRALCAVWTRGVGVHGGTYDARDLHDVQWPNAHIEGLSEQATNSVWRGRLLVSPRVAEANLRRCVVEMSTAALPDLQPMHDEMRQLGYRDTLYVNALDLEHRGVLVALWSHDEGAPPPADRDLFVRLSHHLSAAHRCRRRLGAAPKQDATLGAAAILDQQRRVVHAEGDAAGRSAREALVASARAWDRARTTGPQVIERVARFRPLTSAQWTLVETYEKDGSRYLVARENQAQILGLQALSARERQVVAYGVAGQSTKETAYALGISANTVRVLLSRAATKLGVKTRAELLAHPQIRAWLEGKPK